MPIGASLFLIAVGAILTWAVKFTMAGIDIMAVGVILMVVGFGGMAWSMLFWTSFAPFGTRKAVVETTEVVDVADVPHRRI